MDISLKHLQMIERGIKRQILTLKYPRRQSDLDGEIATVEEYEQLLDMIEQLILKQ